MKAKFFKYPICAALNGLLAVLLLPTLDAHGASLWLETLTSTLTAIALFEAWELGRVILQHE